MEIGSLHKHTKYLHVNRFSTYGSLYVVRVQIKGKNFIVWKGNNYAVGADIAKIVQKHMDIGVSDFLDWYDNKRQKVIEKVVLKHNKKE